MAVAAAGRPPALSRDGLEVLCGEIDYYLRSYDPATGLQRGGDLLREPQTGAWGSGSSSWTDYGLGEMVEGRATGSPDGRLLFTLSAGGVARVWDTSLCRLMQTPSTITRRHLRNLQIQPHADTQAAYSTSGSPLGCRRERRATANGTWPGPPPANAWAVRYTASGAA